MRWVKEYAAPVVILSAAALLVAFALWVTAAPGQSAAVEGTRAVLEQTREQGRPDLGQLGPIVVFAASGVKVGLLMLLPGFVTLTVLKRVSARE